MKKNRNKQIFENPYFEDGAKSVLLVSYDNNIRLYIDVDDCTELEYETIIELTDVIIQQVSKAPEEWKSAIKRAEDRCKKVAKKHADD